MNSPLIFAYGFDKKGSGFEIKEESIFDQIKSNKLIWLHLDVDHEKTSSWLKKYFPNLEEFVVEALLAEETRPRMMQIKDDILLIMRGVNLNENSTPEDMVSIRLWVNKNYIISTRKRKLKAISDIQEQINHKKSPKNAGDFANTLITKLFKRIEPTLSNLDERIDDIEEKIIDFANSNMREEIANIRKQSIIFRRYMAPQRDAISQLSSANVSWLDQKQKQQIQESHNHIVRYIEDLDAIRERSQIIKDELSNILADKLNKNMYFLSIISAIFLPLGFLTGLLGVNLAGIPGANYNLAFWLFSGILLLIITIQIFIFKKFKWF